MHIFSFTSVGAGLLLFQEAAALRIPLLHLRRQDSTPAPGPEVELLTDRNLTVLSAPFLPPPTNGFIRLAAFHPTNPFSPQNITITRRGDTPRIRPIRPDTPITASRFPPDTLPNPIIAPVPRPERLSSPYFSIGKVTTRTAAGSLIATCTGTLVGSRIFLTALHCVQNKPTSGWSLTFTPAFDATNPNIPSPGAGPAGNAFSSSKCYGLKDGGISTSEVATLQGTDYVICVLDEAIGLQLGYLGTNTPDPQNVVTNATDYYLGRSWFSVGYPGNVGGGREPIRAGEVWIGRVERSSEDVGNKVLATHPFSDGGWSGGPLYGLSEVQNGHGGDDAELIGVLSGMRVVDTEDGMVYMASLYGGGPRLTKLVAWGRCEWPGWGGECS
ncbi:hypothetical protein B0T14DRAFT_492136 [Immersiella caudata]|uniref:Serine protease n=1 Tax=Immersiella caudata TaxID=314043 RepID=A0AA39XJB1_9PEZI|nr:hypothetical protein B0T14DRAFT_492136 [Immersiella caudata]